MKVKQVIFLKSLTPSSNNMLYPKEDPRRQKLMYCVRFYRASTIASLLPVQELRVRNRCRERLCLCESNCSTRCRVCPCSIRVASLNHTIALWKLFMPTWRLTPLYRGQRIKCAPIVVASTQCISRRRRIARRFILYLSFTSLCDPC